MVIIGVHPCDTRKSHSQKTCYIHIASSLIDKNQHKDKIHIETVLTLIKRKTNFSYFATFTLSEMHIFFFYLIINLSCLILHIHFHFNMCNIYQV